MTQATLDVHFGRLDGLLKGKPLPMQNGGTRTASADEFMLMNSPINGKAKASFKHRDTRRYVHVRHNGIADVLEVEGGGYFDWFEIPV